MEEVEQGCALHTLWNYQETAKRRGLTVVLISHAIPGAPDGINAYEYRGNKMLRWLCFFPQMPLECKCTAMTIPADWKTQQV